MGTFLRGDTDEEVEMEVIEPSLFSVVVFYTQEIVRLLIIYYLIGLLIVGITCPYQLGEYFGLIIKGFKDAVE
jgi:hypothetical protein